MTAEPAPILELDAVCKRFGDTVTADMLSLAVERGAFVTLLGPSGSGKSTLLRMVAGLERPDSGRILIEGRDVAGVAPWRRNLGMVFQSYAVFPHMTVAQNVAYGLTVRKVPRQLRARRVAEMLELVGLPGFEDRDITRLSGGEQQRVALARALAPQPRMLLLDEPLSALDEKIRREMQSELKHIQRRTGTTFLYVTHDQEEALTMSDAIAVLNRGMCAQYDAPDVVFRRPRSRFVASFFRGCNVLDAACRISNGQMMLAVGGAEMAVPATATSVAAGARVAIAVRCEDLHLGARAQTCAAHFAARVEDIIYRGTNVDHVLRLADGQVVLATSTRRELDDGAADVIIGCDPADIVVLER
ncbi:MAG: ABC transporter ATP-binding protein [Xanthobacteraceae bacterium]